LLAIAVAISQYQIIPAAPKTACLKIKSKASPSTKLSRNSPLKLREPSSFNNKNED